MSWVAERQTKREEDMVYSLSGIFGASMPLIYGERRMKAAFRLYKQIEESTVYTDSACRFMDNNDLVQTQDMRQLRSSPECASPPLGSPLRVSPRMQDMNLETESHRIINVGFWSSRAKGETSEKRIQGKDIATSHWQPAFGCETCEKKFYNHIATGQHMDATSHWRSRSRRKAGGKRLQNQVAAS